MDKKSGD